MVPSVLKNLHYYPTRTQPIRQPATHPTLGHRRCTTGQVRAGLTLKLADLLHWVRAPLRLEVLSG